MKDMMIDIETLGTRDDAIVVSIGAQLFDATTGELGNFFYQKLNFQDQINLGRKPTEATIQWWLEQTLEAQAVFQEKGENTKDVLLKFYYFCKEVPGLRAWGNGPSFDLTILETLFRTFGYEDIPWDFRRVRCLRTFREYIYDGYDLEREGIYHHALDDCKHQIKIVTKGLELRRKNESV